MSVTPAPGAPLIEATSLTKRFGSFVAVDGIDFEVQPRRGLRLPRPQRRGQDLHHAHDRGGLPRHRGPAAHPRPRPGHRRVRASAARLGVVPQEDSLDLELTVFENLLIYGRYFGMSAPRDPQARRRAARVRPPLRPAATTRSTRCRAGMKRRLTIARSLINDPDPGAARRAHHRPRPAGAPRAVGPAVPPQAAGRHPGAHHALHGRGRAAVRPPRGHGRRPRSWPRGRRAELIERYATREVVELRFAVGQQDDAVPRLEGLGDRLEVLPDRVLVYTDDGDKVAAEATERGLVARERGGPPRQPGRRLPPAHRSHPGRLTVSSPSSPRRRPAAGSRPRPAVHACRRAAGLRVLPAHLPPHLARLGGVVVPQPRAVPAGHGGRPGQPGRQGPRQWGHRSLGNVTYLQYLAPGLLAATLMQIAAFECTYPVMAAIKWVRTYFAMLASPVGRHGHRARALPVGRGTPVHDRGHLRGGHGAVRCRRVGRRSCGPSPCRSSPGSPSPRPSPRSRPTRRQRRGVRRALPAS